MYIVFILKAFAELLWTQKELMAAYSDSNYPKIYLETQLISVLPRAIKDMGQ